MPSTAWVFGPSRRDCVVRVHRRRPGESTLTVVAGHPDVDPCCLPEVEHAAERWLVDHRLDAEPRGGRHLVGGHQITRVGGDRHHDIAVAWAIHLVVTAAVLDEGSVAVDVAPSPPSLPHAPRSATQHNMVVHRFIMSPFGATRFGVSPPRYAGVEAINQLHDHGEPRASQG